MLAAVMFSVALPAFESFTVCVPLLPTAIPVKVTDAGLIESCAVVAVADPVKPILRGEPGALLLIDMVPVALPAVVGVNVAVKDAVWPGFKVCAATVLIVNPVPLAEPLLIDIAAVPEFVSVTGIALFPPTNTLPKLTLDGLGVNAPCMPVPVRATVKGEFGALLVTLRSPVALPEACGLN